MNRVERITTLTVFLASWALGAPSQENADRSALHAHYEAGYRLQLAGKVDQADEEFVSFLVKALDHLGNGYANTGNYAKAKPIYQEAVRLRPADPEVLHDYASAALGAEDNEMAERLLSSVLALSTAIPRAELAEDHLFRGRLELATRGRQADLKEFRTAVELNATCENIYAFANAELAVNGPAGAQKDYMRYRTRCGNTPQVRIQIGRAYAINGSPDLALAEFRAAADLDPRFPEVHYCLGAAYLQSSKSNFDSAEEEFRKELSLHPNDHFSYAQLGHIAVLRHRNEEAERDYHRAIELDPREPSNFIELGQLLSESNRGAEAEPLLRKAIDLTPDASRSHYDIERAHFQLGRILMKEGRKEDAQREMSIAADQLNRSRHQAELDLTGDAGGSSNPLAVTRIPTEQERVQVESSVRGIATLLASVYNNLGVNLANAGNFADAAADFRAAAQWNPTLAEVDVNWGRAAYLAGQYSDAVPPLERALHAHPSDSELSNMLEVCREHTSATSAEP